MIGIGCHPTGLRRLPRHAVFTNISYKCIVPPEIGQTRFNLTWLLYGYGNGTWVRVFKASIFIDVAERCYGIAGISDKPVARNGGGVKNEHEHGYMGTCRRWWPMLLLAVAVCARVSNPNVHVKSKLLVWTRTLTSTSTHEKLSSHGIC